MKQPSTASKGRKNKSSGAAGASNRRSPGKAQGSSRTSRNDSSGSRSDSSSRSSSSRSSGNSRSSSGGSRGSSDSTSSRSGQRSNSLSSSMRGNQSSASNRSRGSSSKQGGEDYLEKFFMDQVRDIYYAEHKLIDALNTLKEAATTEELQDAFEDHLHQTERHIRRLEKVFATMGMKTEGKQCEAIEGIIREAQTIINETQEGTMTRDAALILAAQKVEHYEIATYGGLVTLAITMDMFEAADLLDRTLMEEEATDLLLTDIAENYINLVAEDESSGGMELEEEEEEEMEEGRAQEDQTSMHEGEEEEEEEETPTIQ